MAPGWQADRLGRGVCGSDQPDRLDPMTNGFVEAERERLATGTEGGERRVGGAA